MEENNRQNSRAAGEIDDSIIARGSRDLVVASKRKVEKGKRANREGAVGGNTGGRQDWGNCDGARRLLRCWLDGATWATEPFPSCDPRIPPSHPRALLLWPCAATHSPLLGGTADIHSRRTAGIIQGSVVLCARPASSPLSYSHTLSVRRSTAQALRKLHTTHSHLPTVFAFLTCFCRVLGVCDASTRSVLDLILAPRPAVPSVRQILSRHIHPMARAETEAKFP